MRLSEAYPSIEEIWLLGSRANRRARQDSDWDYLVFAKDPSLLNSLAQNQRFHQSDIDLFVVADGVCFMRPWVDEHGEHKKGYLDASVAGWCWKRLSEHEATYREAIDLPGPSMVIRFRDARAVRVYPKVGT